MVPGLGGWRRNCIKKCRQRTSLRNHVIRDPENKSPRFFLNQSVLTDILQSYYQVRYEKMCLEIVFKNILFIIVK